MNQETATPNLEVKYAGFWKRIGSHFLDLLILSPLMIPAYLFYSFKTYYYIYFIPGLLLGLFYQVYLVQKYGGTPGKRIMKIEIRKLDLSKVTYKDAFLRYSVLFVLSIFQHVGLLMGVMALAESDMSGLSYIEFSVKLASAAPPFYQQVSMLMGIWVWIEFIVIFFNKKKRAPHDFIAGTVVVESQSLKLQAASG